MIRVIITTLLPYVFRLLVLISVFHGFRFLIRAWKGLGRR